MKINVKSVKKAVLGLMDDDGISPEELHNLSGVSKATLYNIFSGKNKSIQRATIGVALLQTV